MSTAGLGGTGWLAICLEPVMGTYVAPGASGSGAVWVPILSESLAYKDEKYYSEQIRGDLIESAVVPSYYHVEGDIKMEADAQFLPYFLYASRHDITKTGASGVSGSTDYVFEPSLAASASSTGSGANSRTASITVVRNGLAFGYAGCTMGSIEATLDNGILQFTFGVFGLSEQGLGATGTPAWVASALMGATQHQVQVGVAGDPPTSLTASTAFNGFTANINYNAAAQNRVSGLRSATYVSYGKLEATYQTELDFLDRAGYDAYVAGTEQSVRFESRNNRGASGTDTWAAATTGVQLDFNRSVYDSYEVGLGSMSDLIMANTTGRALGVAGGNPIRITVRSTASIT